jgi:4'-phosphopantetheinyl transferase superfamily
VSSALDAISPAAPAIAGLEELASSPPALRELAVAAPAGERAPRVVFVDASCAARSGATATGMQERALREWVRQFDARTAATHSSRSYRLPLALLAWHGAPVGVDIERVEQCDERFAESIQTPRERALEVPDDRDRHFTALWSSKEALSKALGNPLAYDPRRLEGAGSWPHGRSGPWRAAPLDVGAAHVAWVCWRAA